MTFYEPGLVYENVRKMFTYRGLEPVEAQLAESAVSRVMNTHGIIALTARPSGGTQTTLTALIIAPGSEYATKAAEMNKILARFVRDHDAAVKSGTATDEYGLMMVGSSFDTNTADYYVHVMKALDAFGHANPNIYLEVCDYSVFLIEIPKHCMSAKHWIPSAAEVDDFCKRYGKKRSDFPRIKAKDPQATWIGLRPGMVCAVDRVSETAGKAFVYKICTN